MPFFGRSAELADLFSWLSPDSPERDPDARLVTVTGPGGIGKTRFITEVVRRSKEALPERLIVVCALDDGMDPALAGDVLAAATGAGSKLEAIEGIGQAPEPIVVLDGGDRILDAVREMAHALLSSSIDAVVMVGSRTRLGLAGERIVDLGPLDPVAARAMLEDAIRARGAAVPDRDRSLLDELAVDLEGIPLALELAAARVPVMGLRPLLHRLRTRKTDVLRGLDTAIDASWHAAEAHERAALAQATVFRGGFTLEGAEAILVLPKGVAIADVLDALLGRSLMRRTPDGRLALYGPVRDFAAARLDPAEAARVKQRHIDWYAHRAATADRAWLAAESENLLSVIASVLEAGPVTPRRAEPALRLLVSALPVLVGTAPLDAFDALLDPVLQATKASGVDAMLLIRVMAARGILRRHRGHAREGADDLVRALAAVRTTGSGAGGAIEAELLVELGHALFEARLPEARDHFVRALAIAQSAGDTFVQARALLGEAMVLHRSFELVQAAALIERAIALQPPTAEALHALGSVRIDQGKHDDAKSVLARARDIALENHDRRRAASIDATLGLLAIDAGELDAARTILEASAMRLGDLGATHARARALALLGIAEHEADRSAEAWALLSQALQQLGESDPTLSACCSAHLATLDRAAGLERRGDRANPTALEAAASDSALVRSVQRCTKHQHAAPPPEDALVVATDGTWFRLPGGTRVPLDRRRPLARMLAAMARSPNQSFTSAALLAAGWPSERVIAEAGAHRVRVGIATLRKLGLRDAIKTSEDGYALIAKLAVV
jgi:predicted ATPase